MQKVTLQPGDYVATADIKDKAEYHAIARAFMEAGADKYEHKYGYKWVSNWHFFGWEDEGLAFWDTAERFSKTSRQLTPAQILGEPQWVPEVGEECEYYYSEGAEWRSGKVVAFYKGEAILVDSEDGMAVNGNIVRKAITEEDRAVEEMIMLLQTELGIHDMAQGIAETFYAAGYRKQPQPEGEVDFNDPANWRAGDVVECIASSEFFTEGNLYELIEWGSGSVLHINGKSITVKEDDEGHDYYAPASNFRFHSRP